MNWEEQLGIKLSAFVGGIIGGIVSLTFEEKLSFIRAVLLIFTGGVMAGYGFTGAQQYLHTDVHLSGLVGFSIGLLSMRIVKLIFKIADRIIANPAIIFSYVELIKNLKNGSSNTSSSSEQSDIYSTRESDQADRKETTPKIRD